MATFEAKVYKLRIEEHPNADVLELAVVGDYRSIVRKGQFKTGDLGAYIPEAAVLEDWLIEELGLVGKLAGKQKNRVKAIKLRGILSQGLIVPVKHIIDVDETAYYVENEHKDELWLVEGDDVTEHLGITKYEPPIPIHMSGEVFNAFGMTPKYDIENIKRFPDVLLEGEDVVVTEKIHGTWGCFGYHPEITHPVVTSKGLSDKGLAFKFNDANDCNLYVRAFHNTTNTTGDDVVTRARRYGIFGDLTPFYILGEIFGAGVQDLHYGATQPKFRVFDIYVGEPGHGGYVSAEMLQSVSAALGMSTVPVLYTGPFSKEKIAEVTNGRETVSGNEINIREGVVIKPAKEKRHDEIGRVILKSVSENYLLRKGGTEFN